MTAANKQDLIEVDGKWRPTTNAKGRLIHPTLEGIANFWRWFGDSQVIDGEGRPLVVYHGTNQAFAKFSKSRLGRNTSSASACEFFFTEDVAEAEDYAHMASRHMPSEGVSIEKESAKIQAKLAAAERAGNWGLVERLTSQWEELELNGLREGEVGQQILPVYLRIIEPRARNFRDTFDGHELLDEMDQAKKAGQDGMHLINVYDPVGSRRSPESTTQWVVFKPGQIKSAIGNKGTFSRKSTVMTNPGTPKVMPYAAAHKWEPLAQQWNVSAVARSARGFMRAYQKAGTWSKLPEFWQRRRNGFVARHMAQVPMTGESLWKTDKKTGKRMPSRRCLALIMWAFMPPGR